MMGILGTIGGGLLSRGTDWLLGKIFGGGAPRKPTAHEMYLVNKTQQQALDYVLGKSKPTQSPQQGVFYDTMRRFGDTIQSKIQKSRLSPVMDGINVGDAFYQGMSNVYNLLKGGGDQAQSYEGGGGQMPGGVEKPAPGQGANFANQQFS